MSLYESSSRACQTRRLRHINRDIFFTMHFTCLEYVTTLTPTFLHVIGHAISRYDYENIRPVYRLSSRHEPAISSAITTLTFHDAFAFAAACFDSARYMPSRCCRYATAFASTPCKARIHTGTAVSLETAMITLYRCSEGIGRGGRPEYRHMTAPSTCRHMEKMATRRATI